MDRLFCGVLVASAAVMVLMVNLFELNRLPKPRRWLLSIKLADNGWGRPPSFDEVTSTLDVAREQAAQHRPTYGLPRHKRRHARAPGRPCPGTLRNTVAPCNDPEMASLQLCGPKLQTMRCAR
jgi:hypothetical protein